VRPGRTTQRVEHPGSVIDELGVDCDVVALATKARRREFRQSGCRRVELPARIRRLDAILGMDAQPDACADREGLVIPGLLEKQRLHRLQPFRLPGGEVLGLREVRLEVVEFPDVLAGIPRGEPRAHGEPRRQRAEGAGEPAVLIDAAAAVIIEILDVLAPWGLRVSEGIDHAGAVDRVLLEAVDDLGWLDAEDLIDRRHDIVDVMELRSRHLVRLDARRP